jgi:ADP-ribosylglycohydrolase
MLGAICGDVIGSVYEFNNTKDYDFPLLTKESSYTDDSIMTAAVALWIMNDPEHTYWQLDRLMHKVANMQDFKHPMGGYGSNFQAWLYGKQWTLPEYVHYDIPDLPDPRYCHPEVGCGHPYNSCGNGSAMRVSPVGWAFDTLEETERVAGISARITHSHPEGIKGAQSTAASIWMARKGKTKEEIRDYISAKYGYDLSKSWDYWHKNYHWDATCQGTVPQALICFLESTDFIDAIRKAVSLGGDSDTLACITGGIAEAYYSIPECLLQDVLPHVNHIIVRWVCDCCTDYKEFLRKHYHIIGF